MVGSDLSRDQCCGACIDSGAAEDVLVCVDCTSMAAIVCVDELEEFTSKKSLMDAMGKAKPQSAQRRTEEDRGFVVPGIKTAVALAGFKLYSQRHDSDPS